MLRNFMDIVWTKHAADRQKEWEKKLGITRQEVEELLRNPEQDPHRVLDQQGGQVLEERGNGMRIRYDPDAHVLCLLLRSDPPVDALEEPGGVIVSYGENGEPVSVEFLNASARRLILPGEVSVTIQTESPR